MKNVRIYNKQNQIISDKNVYEYPTEFTEFNVSINAWGKPIRWVRAWVEKEFAYDEQTNPEAKWFPDEEYDEADVLRTEVRLTGNVIPDTDPIEREPETWVELKAEYTIEITDYIKVPQEISRAQLQLALLNLALLDTIEAFIESPQCPRAIKIEWNNRLTFKRDNENLKSFATVLEITPETLDQIFILGETL